MWLPSTTMGNFLSTLPRRKPWKSYWIVKLNSEVLILFRLFIFQFLKHLFPGYVGIDCDAARSQEERQMLTDTARWLEGDVESSRLLQPHLRTGATALHVASAKGYIRVMSMLVQGGVDLNSQDIDGWTPLHAAAHWGQREACQLLCENMADMEIRNYVVSLFICVETYFLNWK